MLGYPNSTTALVVLGPSLRERKLTGATICVCFCIEKRTHCATQENVDSRVE